MPTFAKAFIVVVIFLVVLGVALVISHEQQVQTDHAAAVQSLSNGLDQYSTNSYLTAVTQATLTP